MVLRIGTRGSALALWQARSVAARLEQAGARVEIVTIVTTGDRREGAPSPATATKRVFVKEIEEALISKEIDIAVHSAKDMPAQDPDGLAVAAVLPRDDPRDALVLSPSPETGGLDVALARLGPAASIGTGSVRRIAQLSALLPRATFAPIRGNVDTRLRKLDAGDYDALILAAAGLRRLGLGARISAAIPIEDSVPAPGQGIVAIQVREEDLRAAEAVRQIGDEPAWLSLMAERAVVLGLGGGCDLPLGAIALHQNGQNGQNGSMRALAVVASLDGRQILRRDTSGPASDAAGIGRKLAGMLAEAGAGDILGQARDGVT